VLNHWPYLQINNAHDFVFDGNGATLYFTGPTRGIDINNSQRVVIQNLTVDYGSPVDPNPLWRGPLFATIGTIVPDGASSAHIILDADTPIRPGFSPYMYAFNLWDRKKNEIAHDDYLNTGPNDQGCDYACIASHGKQDPSQQSMYLKNGSLYPKSNASGKWVGSQGGDFSHEGDDGLNVTVVSDTLTTVKSASSFVISGPDAAPTVGDTLAFFDQGLGYLGSATIESISPSNFLPWGGQPITVGLSATVNWLSPGIYVTDISHVPSRVYISGVHIHDKLGRGILLGGFHMLVQNSSFRNITAMGIDAIFSTYFQESTGVSDIAIRKNTFVGTNYVPKLYQTSVDGTNYYPVRNASIVMFGDLWIHIHNAPLVNQIS